MSEKGVRAADAAELRRRAEERLRKVRSGIGRLARGDAEKLLHELEVYHIELEMVNEEVRRAKEEVEAGLERYMDLYDYAPVGYLSLDIDGKILFANLTSVRMLGQDRSGLQKRRIQQFVSVEDRPAIDAFLRKVFESDTREVCEVSILAEGKPPLVVQIEGTIHGPGRECRVALSDITKQKNLQEQLRHAHKMEVIGQLAAGIAHDFNNLLTTILGYSELLLDRMSSGDPTRKMVEEIRKAGDHASALTQQLLAFGRKQVLQPQVVNLGDLLSRMKKMLGRMTGPEITLAVEPDPALWSILADPVQVEQTLLNLVSNSRDAMTGRGALSISAENVILTDSIERSHPTLKAGQYVALSVRDTGCGMSMEELSHLFEPFYTTKEIGKGTGLGLASVYGIVQQSDAHIDVTSEVGKGTTFRIYFPRVTEQAETTKAPEATDKPLAGTETILVVDDEEVILGLVTRVLTNLGYTVLGASGGEEALTLLREKGAEIRLILTDVLMPRMDGCELALRASTLRPGIRLLFMSGYPKSEYRNEKKFPAGTSFIQKPFSPMGLARIVRDTLDHPPGA